MIPREIIELKNLYPMRGSVFIYLAIRRSLDDKAYIMLNDLVEFSGNKPDKNKDGINHKFIVLLDALESIDYFVKKKGNYSGSKAVILLLNNEKFDIPNSFA